MTRFRENMPKCGINNFSPFIVIQVDFCQKMNK